MKFGVKERKFMKRHWRWNKILSGLALYQGMSVSVEAQVVEMEGTSYVFLSDSTVELASFVPPFSLEDWDDTLCVPEAVSYGNKIYKVTAMGERVFGSDSLTRRFCRSVVDVVFPEGLEGIATDAFYGRFYSLKKLVLPQSLRSLGENSFACLPSLDEVVIRGVREVPAWAFSLNPSLAVVSLDSCVSVIGRNSFYECTRLSRVDLRSVVEIGDNAFEGTSIDVLAVPNVESVGESSFMGCKSLTRIHFTPKLRRIAAFAFSDDTALLSIHVPAGEIGESAFMGCTSLRQVVLSDSVYSLGEATFLGCVSLDSVCLSSSLDKISAMTFCGCVDLESVALPSTVRSIGKEAFAGSGLKRIDIPGSVKEIGDGAFAQCEHLEEVILRNPDVLLGKAVFPKDTKIRYMEKY